MSLTTIVGALLAVVARPQAVGVRLEKQERTKEEREIGHLARSHARLVDHIERLERELALAQELLAHWRDEAARLARENHERRAMAQYNAIMAQQQQAQQNALGQESVCQGFCNCVPSRAQIWGAQHGLVQQLNDNTVHGAVIRLNEEN